LALLLVARVENLLQLRHATFLMDNLSLARTAATKSATDPQVLREIRQQIAQFKQEGACRQRRSGAGVPELAE
jgi:hypothetical protein